MAGKLRNRDTAKTAADQAVINGQITSEGFAGKLRNEIIGCPTGGVNVLMVSTGTAGGFARFAMRRGFIKIGFHDGGGCDGVGIGLGSVHELRQGDP